MPGVLDCSGMIRLIDRYLLREIIPYVLLVLVLLTAVIFAQQGSSFSGLLVIATRNGSPIEALWRLMSALVPTILVFTIPISLLMGILVALGRLSGDSEIVALGASGVSREQLLKPIMAISFVVSLMMFYLTFSILPRSVHILNDLKANRTEFLQFSKNEIKPRVFLDSIPNRILYIEEIDRARNIWKNIFLVDLGADKNVLDVLTATSGSLRQGITTGTPELVLEKGFTHFQIPEAQNNQDQPQISKKETKNEKDYTFNRFDSLTIGLDIPADRSLDNVEARPDRQLVTEMEWTDLTTYTPPESDYLKWKAQIHERIVVPMACIIFAVLGVAFGVSGVRTGRSFGFLLGLAITIIYYLLFLMGKHYAVSGKLPVWIGMWLGNLFFTIFGFAMLIFQRRPGADLLSIITSIRRARQEHKQWEHDEAALRERESLQEKSGIAPSRRTLSVNGRSRFSFILTGIKFSRLIDGLILSDMVRFYFYMLTGFSALTLVITLFQRLDNITKNNTEWMVVFNYLVFLLPMILNSMAPIAGLIAVMVTFGILEKSSQVVAMKASGQSIYRLAVPALALSLVLSGLVFLNQDYVLPFTNRRQENLLNVIISGQQPPQTVDPAKNKWIFGRDSRIYNYYYFDPTGNAFKQLTILDLSREPFGVKRRIFAERATWDASSEGWILEHGWEREFEENRVRVDYFDVKRFSFQEYPDYFKKDLREASMMTLAELKRHIDDLSSSGFDVMELRVAFHSKIAFPLACLVMMIVGLPFAFSVGKRGALYGVTIGILIGLFYWGMLGLFGQMGRYEILPPILAAWGPNLLFGAGGIYLFLTSRT